MEEYRVIKEQFMIADLTNEGYQFPAYDGSDVQTITRYLVQVRSFIFWHTVKAFEKIMPAARLLHHLKGLNG